MATQPRSVNPNKDRSDLDALDLDDKTVMPKFIKSLKFHPFRHIQDLEVSFIHPITVISGSNRSGKTSILMAIACSHIKFYKRNSINGNLERKTWGNFIKFTHHDTQSDDWVYSITYKRGDKVTPKTGRRKFSTNKWSGVAKKESQIPDGSVTYIDIDRILPARFFPPVMLSKSKKLKTPNPPSSQDKRIQDYLSHILEDNYSVQNLVSHQDKDIYGYSSSTHKYSSLNSATGEDVLSKIIRECVTAEKNSLILIDEIELGLHPKVQQRLMDVIYNISYNDHKQFIITTHSSTIISSVGEKSRIFIDKESNGSYRAIAGLGINGSLSKMDYKNHPVLEVYCEDGISCEIIKRAIELINSSGYIKNIHHLIKPIIIGSSSACYDALLFQHKVHEHRTIKTGYCCILDGDMKNDPKFDHSNPNLFFLYGNRPPEIEIFDVYERLYPDTGARYYIDNYQNHGDPHILPEKIVEFYHATDKNKAIEMGLNAFFSQQEGLDFLNELSNFLKSRFKYFNSNY